MTLKFIIAALACWRLSSLLANEAGVFYVFHKIRKLAERLERRTRFWRAFHLSEGVGCEWCNSVWFGTIIAAVWFNSEPSFTPLYALALSAGAIMVKYVVQTLQALKENIEAMNRYYTEPPHSTEGTTGKLVMPVNAFTNLMNERN